MDPTIFLGVIIGVGLLLKSIGLEFGLKFFLHYPSMLVVLGGTVGATLVHFPLSQMLRLGRRLRVVFSLKVMNPTKDIELVTHLADRVRKEGRLSLNSVIPSLKDNYLQSALQLLVDKVSPEELEKIMKDNLLYMQARHDMGIRFFEQMAKYAPGFGLLGTLIGLILLLAQLDDPKSVGPNMSIALITTFYGVLLSNLVFLPLAGRLRISSNEEIMQKEMVLEGILSMAKGESGYIIREKMMMFLSEHEKKKVIRNHQSKKKKKA